MRVGAWKWSVTGGRRSGPEREARGRARLVVLVGALDLWRRHAPGVRGVSAPANVRVGAWDCRHLEMELPDAGAWSKQ
eukprot:5206355-Prymnesium_polylepis.3